LLHVAHIPHAAMDSPMPIEPNPPWEQHARTELEQLAAEALHDVRYHILVRSGIAPHEILHAASEIKADLIVMATHGRSGINHLLMGSVAELVLRQATCPVLVMRPR
jgi:nucleotide-binding universal stress UspA family protein